MNLLDSFFINQSHNCGKLTFVLRKKGGYAEASRPFNFDL